MQLLWVGAAADLYDFDDEKVRGVPKLSELLYSSLLNVFWSTLLFTECFCG